tara:strand:- start:878 stop:1231 length:354 start_codon:yes stop_codon:yes gene_type:complete
MTKPELIKVYFYHTYAEGQYSPSEAELQDAINNQPLGGVFSGVPSDRSAITDYDAMTTTKQFFTTKVHAVYEGGHTLDVWTDLNSLGDKSWMGFSDYCDLEGMLGDYAWELPDLAED